MRNTGIMRMPWGLVKRYHHITTLINRCSSEKWCVNHSEIRATFPAQLLTSYNAQSHDGIPRADMPIKSAPLLIASNVCVNSRLLPGVIDVSGLSHMSGCLCCALGISDEALLHSNEWFSQHTLIASLTHFVHTNHPHQALEASANCNIVDCRYNKLANCRHTLQKSYVLQTPKKNTRMKPRRASICLMHKLRYETQQRAKNHLWGKLLCRYAYEFRMCLECLSCVCVFFQTAHNKETQHFQQHNTTPTLNKKQICKNPFVTCVNRCANGEAYWKNLHTRHTKRIVCNVRKNPFAERAHRRGSGGGIASEWSAR